MKTKLCYFSASGNSLKVAKDIKDNIDGDARLISIAKATQSDIDEDCDVIGLIFPVHAWGAPKLVGDFIQKIKPANYNFAVVTHAGMPGDALKQVDKLLKLKDGNLASGFEIQMPSCYIPWQDAPKEEVQIKLFKAEQEKVKNIISIVNSATHRGLEKKITGLNWLFSGPIYKSSINNFYRLSKNFWTDGNCNNCGICAKICSFGNIVIEAKPKWENKCTACMACIQWCPKKSIQYGKSTVSKNRYTHPDIKISEMMKTNG